VLLNLGVSRDVRLFLRDDGFGGFVSCLVHMPRDRYTTAVAFASATSWCANWMACPLSTPRE
jgi:NAD-specific glutamate dehydrogenase